MANELVLSGQAIAKLSDLITNLIKAKNVDDEVLAKAQADTAQAFADADAATTAKLNDLIVLAAGATAPTV